MSLWINTMSSRDWEHSLLVTILGPRCGASFLRSSRTGGMLLPYLSLLISSHLWDPYVVLRRLGLSWQAGGLARARDINALSCQILDNPVFFSVRGEVGEVHFWALVLERVLVSLCSDVLATPGLPSNRALLMRAVQCIWCGGHEARRGRWLLCGGVSWWGVRWVEMTLWVPLESGPMSFGVCTTSWLLPGP